MWRYIKERNLQNPQDKREIICDDKLEKLFKKKKIAMFKMTKELSAVL
jgi:upstream activation factor subunit UAF30